MLRFLRFVYVHMLNACNYFPAFASATALDLFAEDERAIRSCFCPLFAKIWIAAFIRNT